MKMVQIQRLVGRFQTRPTTLPMGELRFCETVGDLGQVTDARLVLAWPS